MKFTVTVAMETAITTNNMYTSWLPDVSPSSDCTVNVISNMMGSWLTSVVWNNSYISTELS